MSDGNIIRSKNHTVTIEKGSKNAKGRSAHMEEWLDPVEGAPEAHEEDKIFQSNVQSNPGSPFELSTSSDPQNQGVRTAAQKMADLQGQLRSVNDSLDDFKSPTGQPSNSATAPFLSLIHI